MHRGILAAALLVIVVFGGLTASVIASDGVGPLEVASLVVLGMFAFGIIGALRQPPE